MKLDWSVIGDKLITTLPILGAALGGPLGGAAGKVVSEILGVENNPEAVMTALGDPQAIITLKQAQIESDKQITLAYVAAETRRLEIVNKTIRNEANSFDWFVRRWRPFYGYCLAVTWTIQMIMITYYIGDALTDTNVKFAEAVAPLVSVFTIIAGMWTVALTVLGVSVHSRTKDKQISIPQRIKDYVKGDE